VLRALGVIFAVLAITWQLRAADTVVGWRGDGSGRYPDARPPTQWYLQEDGQSKNILWKTKLPCYSWSTPVIVGEKIFTRCEPYDLTCLDKNTGKLLWIRSHPPIMAVSDQQKKDNPAIRAIDPVLDELQKVNDAFVAQGWSKELYKQKYDLQKKINDMTAEADEQYRLPKDMYVESWAGYTGSTPCSDGKFIYLTSGSGIIACYDLDGNRKWVRYESLSSIWGEHGSACSPALVGDKLVVKTKKYAALDKKTGEEILTFAPKGGNDSYTILPFRAGGEDYVIAGGNFLRMRDGKSVFYADLCNMVTTNDNIAYFATFGHTYWARWEPAANGELTVSALIKGEYSRITFPVDDPKLKWEPMHSFYTASPLYHDKLLYCLSNWGKLVVLDTEKSTQAEGLVYSKNLPFTFKNPKGRKSIGMGIGASPALGGKYIYMIDSAGCTIVMEPGREYRQVAMNCIDYTVPEGWEPKHWLGPHHEQTEASLVFDGARIYIRGEQFLYCVGEQ